MCLHVGGDGGPKILRSHAKPSGLPDIPNARLSQGRRFTPAISLGVLYWSNDDFLDNDYFVISRKEPRGMSGRSYISRSSQSRRGGKPASGCGQFYRLVLIKEIQPFVHEVQVIPSLHLSRSVGSERGEGRVKGAPGQPAIPGHPTSA